MAFRHFGAGAGKPHCYIRFALLAVTNLCILLFYLLHACKFVISSVSPHNLAFVIVFDGR